MAIEFNEENFDAEVLQASEPVLVDFWAEWCGPCKMISPLIDAVSKETEGVGKVGKVNVDVAPALAQKYEVQSIPTILYFKNGEEKDRIVGANVTQALLKEKLEALR